MFLSKKWILGIISVTGIAFMILLVIQFGWIRKSIGISRQHFTDRMIITSNKICEAILRDKSLQKNYLSGSLEPQQLFTGRSASQKLESTIKHKVDSVLSAEAMPLKAAMAGQTGNSCYLMAFVPGDKRNVKLDHSSYKLCLCHNSFPASLDIGFDLHSNKMLISDSSGLILPSVILILLLIALFSYIIFVMNRQKKFGELKNDFINNLTHEFNTPLFSIGLTSNLLLRSDAINQSDKLKGYVNLITTEKNRLQTQVDKILRLTAIESGKLILEKERVDMHQLIEENIASFKTILAEKSGTIYFKAEAMRYFVKGDRVHLFNSVNNLLDNAIKYADKVPSIVITTMNIDNELCIKIADNGIGMSSAEINMIFDKFYRVKQGDRHDVKGFGLGLSYVKKIAELHDGSIEVKSIPGESSVFTLRLPNDLN